MTTQTQTMLLLDQYAQESGFVNLEDMKNNYSDRAYAAVMISLLHRAKTEMAAE